MALLALAAGFPVALPAAIVTRIRRGLGAGRPLRPYLIGGTAGVACWSAVTRGLLPLGG